MKLLIIVFVLNATYLSFLHLGSRAQDFDNPSMTFKKFEFERTIGGGFNLSMCLVELLNCMEKIKPDMVCIHYTTFDSSCSLMSDDCDDDGYNSDVDWYRHMMLENVCTWWHQQYT